MNYLPILVFLPLLFFGCICAGLNPSPKPSPTVNGTDYFNNGILPQPVPDDSCSSNSDCGYNEKCKNKQCVEVECTTDSQCSGCKRCSNNECVSCGSGPYGCYC